MSRYIDADAIKDKAWKAESEACFYALEDVVSVTDIDEAPSIDIVRCSECVYCNVQNTKYLYAICERHGIEFKPFEDDTRTHGCAWGKQTEERSE